MPSISVVLPIYRTAQYLDELHRRLTAALAPIAGQHELIMVDDGSPDQAWSQLSALAQRDPRVKALRLSRNFGQHPAITAGFEHARGDVIVLMDADLQDRPEDIPLLLAQLRGEVDIVYSVKKDGAAHPPLVRWSSQLYHAVVARLTGVKVPRHIGTFRLFSRRVLEALRAYPERNILYGPLMFHIGFQSAVVPLQHEARADGKSSYSFRRRLALAVNSLVSYTDLPHRFLAMFGAVVLLCTVLYALILVVRYFIATEALPSGVTLLALLTTTSLGATMLGLGIIGMYVFRVYQEVLQRPRYIIARSINLEEKP